MKSMDSNAVNNAVVICGAGVIGTATAYFLARRGIAVRIVERCAVACAASGKAGGFLALDWCDGSPLSGLARKSFELHAELARTPGFDYGYRRLTTVAVTAREGGTKFSAQARPEFNWLNGNGAVCSLLGTEQTTAQVHPEKFTRTLLQAACASGAELITGRVDGVELDGARVSGVRIDGQVLAAAKVVIAMGPWSALAAQWLPLPPVQGLRGHSIILRPARPLPAQALFIDYQTAGGERLTPEVYPRPDGEVYLSGLSDESPVPESPQLVMPRADAGPVLQKIAGDLCSDLKGLQAERVQACYRPVYHDGLPLLGKVPDIEGAYIATGHSCWGILNAPASGLALAELIVDGVAETVDLTPYDPRRTGHRAGAAALH
jgi:glycine/D-amino acid oxidase-like deaminating enzyme